MDDNPVTARIRSVREGIVFSLFVCPQGWGIPWSSSGNVQGVSRGEGIPKIGQGQDQRVHPIVLTGYAVDGTTLAVMREDFLVKNEKTMVKLILINPNLSVYFIYCTSSKLKIVNFSPFYICLIEQKFFCKNLNFLWIKTDNLLITDLLLRSLH